VRYCEDSEMLSSSGLTASGRSGRVGRLERSCVGFLGGGWGDGRVGYSGNIAAGLRGSA